MPGLFDVLEIKNLHLKNRIMVSPMCQYMAGEDSLVTDWHTVHYGSFALGGPALVMTEATAVEARGRISVHDLGIYDDRHVAPLRKLVEFNHQHGAKMGVQLAHAGRKATTPESAIAPSAVAFSDKFPQPMAMTKAHMQEVMTAFEQAAKRALAAGFDVVEIHAAHGYLLHEFLSPLSNLRTDEDGVTPEGRMRFVLEVIQRVVAVVDGKIPVTVRISASEYHPQGYSLDEVVNFCKQMVQAGIGAIDVSSGGNLPVVPPVYPGYQLPFAQVIKAAVDVPVMAVGMLDNPQLAEHVIQSKKADMVVIGRGFLRDKHWAHFAAQALGQPPQVPESYHRAYM